MVAVNVEGGDKLALLGKALRKLGSDRTIVKNLAKRIRKLAAPIRQELKASALATLPAGGGLNLWVAKARVNVAIRRGVDTAGVDIVEGRNSSRRRSDLRKINQGSVRHQTYGHAPWKLQSIEPGFFTTPLEGSIGDQFQTEALGAIDDAIGEVLHGF